MRKISVEEAVGQELCHDITAIRDGFKGAEFKRGHVITEDDIPRLLNLGKKQVFVWEPDAGEIHEEECAIRLAAVTEIEGAHYEGPFEGKVLLKADISGMFRVNRALLRAINSVGDITFTSIPDHYPVAAGDKLASVRIVPLVTKEEQIIEAERLCRERPLFALRPYRLLKTGIIITGSEIFNGRIQDKFEPVIRCKLESYPTEILGVTICDDNLEMIMDAAASFMDDGADLLVFSGGMSVDPDDLTPTAIRNLCDTFVTQGVPSQPGNMTTIAYKGDVTLVGVPSAAITQPVTVLDAVLPQIFAGDKFTKEELTELGDGGLCMQCKPCHFPCCPYGKY